MRIPCHEERIETLLGEIVHALREIRDELKPKRLAKARIELMPKTIQVGQTSTALIQGLDQNGQPFAIQASDVSLTAAVPADVSFGTPTANPDGSVSIVVTGVNADTGDGITATVLGVTSNSDTLTISAPAPVLTSLQLTLQ